MADNQDKYLGTALDSFTSKQTAGADKEPGGETADDVFQRDFTKLKTAVIRPVLAAIGSMLQERGHEFNISEEQGGKISIHIVPAGAVKSIHPYGWFPTLSFFGAPFTRSIGLHGRNSRPNSETASGPRGEYKLAQVDSAFVEREVTKFISEIANW
jgi:hypothetical protein